MVVAERRARHPQRLEDALVREGAERPARDALDRDREQRVAGVAVEVLRARPEVERRLARQEIEDVALRDDVASPAPARHLQQAPLIPDPARVLREVAQRDRHAVVGELRHVAADVVVPGEPPLAGEERHRQGRELLGDRGDVEDALRGDGDAVLQVGGAVAPGEDDVVALHHRHRAARSVGARPGGEDRVDARFGCGGRSLGRASERNDAGRDEQRGCGQEQGGRQGTGAPGSAGRGHGFSVGACALGRNGAVALPELPGGGAGAVSAPAPPGGGSSPRGGRSPCRSPACARSRWSSRRT